MSRSVCALISMILLLTGISVCSVASPVKLTLSKQNTSYVLSKNYSRSDAKMDFTVNFKSPGVIFDTVGINAAPIGSWTVSISEEGVISFAIYDPTSNSKKKLSNGWHTLSSSFGILKGTPHRIIFTILNGKISLKMDDMPEDVLEIKTLLSGKPLYAGDFPGDDHWGKKYRIHPSMIGTVIINSWGPASAKVSSLTTKKPTSKTTTSKPVTQKPVNKPVVTKPANNTTAANTSTKPSGSTTTSKPADKNVTNVAVLKPTPNDSAATVDAGIQKIKAALEAKDVDRAIALTTGDAKDNLSIMFKQHKEELPRLAALLATRKLVTVSGSYAEYELTENGRIFPAVFYKINGEWRLASL